MRWKKREMQKFLSGDLDLREEDKVIWGGGRGFKEKVFNSDYREFGRKPSGDEWLRGHDFGISGRHLPRLAQIATESRLCRWPEIAKPSSSSPAQLTQVARSLCPHFLPPTLPFTPTPLCRHCSQRSPRQPGGTAALSQFSFLWLLVLPETFSLTLSPHV